MVRAGGKFYSKTAHPRLGDYRDATPALSGPQLLGVGVGELEGLGAKLAKFCSNFVNNCGKIWIFFGCTGADF